MYFVSRLLPLSAVTAVLVMLLACAPAALPQTESAVPSVTSGASPAGATTAAEEVRTAYPLTLTDRAGRRVTLAAAPRRIVSLSPAGTEVLFAVGAGDQLVAVDTFSDYPAEAVKRLPKVAYSNPNLEQIVALGPDLVLAATRQRAQVPELERLGLTVYLREEPETIEATFVDIEEIGRLVDRQSAAAFVTAGLRQRLDAVRARLADVAAGPRVFFEIDPKLFAAAEGSFVGDQLTVLKARNVVPKGERPFPQVSLEAIVAADPEVVLLADSPPTGTETPQTVAARPGWAGLSALRNGRVYPVDGNTASRAGPRVVDSVEAIARLLYPERFR